MAYTLGTLDAVLAVARRNIGVVEGPNNSNIYAPVAGHANNQPWCASFIAAVFKTAGVVLPSYSAYTPTMANGFKAIKRFYQNPIVGDVVFFQWPTMGRIAHVGLVITVNPDGSFSSLEGNTDFAGGRSGGRVMVQHRTRKNVAGFGRPVYRVVRIPVPLKPKAVPRPGYAAAGTNPVLKLGDSGPRVSDIQRGLVKIGNPTLKIDGDFGQSTLAVVRLFQTRHRLVISGIVDSAFWIELRRTIAGLKK